jgi:hypothetical protein
MKTLRTLALCLFLYTVTYMFTVAAVRIGISVPGPASAEVVAQYRRIGRAYAEWGFAVLLFGAPLAAYLAASVWLKERPIRHEWALRYRDDILSLTGPFLAGFQQRNGYEPGENTVRQTRGRENAELLRARFGDLLPDAIREFFGTVCEVSLPDVHPGYFIGPPSSVVGVQRKIGGRQRELLAFGCSGSGSLYAVALDGDPCVYELPARGAAVVVAPRFEDFLGQIRQRLRELTPTGSQS